MTVQVRIPTILRSYTGGAAEVTATEGTLREVIAGLDAVEVPAPIKPTFEAFTERYSETG